MLCTVWVVLDTQGGWFSGRRGLSSLVNDEVETLEAGASRCLLESVVLCTDKDFSFSGQMFSIFRMITEPGCLFGDWHGAHVPV